MSIYESSLQIFRPWVKKYEQKFPKLADDLKRAHMLVPTEQWFAFSLLTTTLTFVVAIAICMLFSFILIESALLAFAVAIVFAFAITVGAALLVFNYPSLVADERKKRIENALPFATLYMATIARSGFPPQDIFRLLSKFKEYGEISKEASKIANDIEALGLDILSSISRAIARSASAEWTELLAGLRTTISVGGDLPKYLDEKSAGFVAEYKRRLGDFSNMLTLLIEVYITLVIVGAIFFIVTTSVMIAVGGVPVELIKAVNLLIVLVGIPLLTAAFILIVKGVSPLED
ncbi:MAG: type II secretion system F family protein [Candidatus Nanoarchaeia archaeon]